MINVLLIGPDYNSKGGIATVIKNYLDTNNNRNFSFLFHAVTRDMNKVFKSLYFIPSILMYINRLLFCNIKVVHAHPSENFGFYRYIPYFIISKLFRKKIIFHIHGCSFDMFLSNQSHIVRRLIIGVLNKCDAIVCLSDTWQVVFKSYGIKNTTVIRNTVKVPELNNYIGGSRIITFIGFINNRKGIFDLINAFSKTDLQSDYTIEVCGTGDNKKLIKQINKLNLKDSILMHGWVNEKQKKEILMRTQILVLPSYAEGLPMVLLEAMSYGIPVISTPVGGIPELVEHNKNGILINPGNINELTKALKKLLRNSELCQKISNENYSKIQAEYSIDSSLNKLHQLYKKILNL